MPIIWYHRLGVRLLCQAQGTKASHQACGGGGGSMMDFYFWSYWVVSIGYYTHYMGVSFQRYLHVRLLGGISTGLAIVLQASIPIRKYLYVKRDETVRRVSSRHLALLM